MLIASKISKALKEKGWKKKDLMNAMGKKNPSEITRWLSGNYLIILYLARIKIYPLKQHLILILFRGTFLHTAILPLINPSDFKKEEK